ncbi:hypothetical protein FB451DRAFT_1180537 [Mycena latifolia]|nr:hypothetical protein FB451DRAFT_1180537 [Mycena latifolia]
MLYACIRPRAFFHAAPRAAVRCLPSRLNLAPLASAADVRARLYLRLLYACTSRGLRELHAGTSRGLRVAYLKRNQRGRTRAYPLHACASQVYCRAPLVRDLRKSARLAPAPPAAFALPAAGRLHLARPRAPILPASECTPAPPATAPHAHLSRWAAVPPPCPPSSRTYTSAPVRAAVPRDTPLGPLRHACWPVALHSGALYLEREGCDLAEGEGRKRAPVASPGFDPSSSLLSVASFSAGLSRRFCIKRLHWGLNLDLRDRALGRMPFAMEVLFHTPSIWDATFPAYSASQGFVDFSRTLAPWPAAQTILSLGAEDILRPLLVTITLSHRVNATISPPIASAYELVRSSQNPRRFSISTFQLYLLIHGNHGSDNLSARAQEWMRRERISLGWLSG